MTFSLIESEFSANNTLQGEALATFNYYFKGLKPKGEVITDKEDSEKNYPCYINRLVDKLTELIQQLDVNKLKEKKMLDNAQIQKIKKDEKIYELLRISSIKR